MMAEASPVDTAFVTLEAVEEGDEEEQNNPADELVDEEGRLHNLETQHDVLHMEEKEEESADDAANLPNEMKGDTLAPEAAIAAAASDAAIGTTSSDGATAAHTPSDPPTKYWGIDHHATPKQQQQKKQQHHRGADVDNASTSNGTGSSNIKNEKVLTAKTIPFGGGIAAAAAATTSTSTSTSTAAKKKPVDSVAAKFNKQPRPVGINFTSSTDDIQLQQQHVPPDGFTLAARIVSVDGKSYFVESTNDDDGNDDDVKRSEDEGASIPSSKNPVADLIVPFLDCGAIGSFTDSIGMKECSFRHLPSGAEPIGWTTVESPQLVAALRPLEVTVSGGGGEDGTAEVRRIFEAGDVLLFEDTDGEGHKMKSAPLKSAGGGGGSLHPDMSVLIVSLPPQRHRSHRSEKERGILHLPALFGRRNRDKDSSGSDVDGKPPRPCLVETDGTYSSLGPASNVIPSPGRFIRATLGAAISALMTHRLVQRTPVGVAWCAGGCALVVGGTCGFAAIGEGTLDSIADWWEGFIVERRFAAREERLNDDDEEALDGFEDEILLFGGVPVEDS